MVPSAWGGDASSRSSRQHADPDEERFTHLLDRAGLLSDRDRHRRESDGTAAEAAAQHAEDRAIQVAQAYAILGAPQKARAVLTAHDARIRDPRLRLREQAQREGRHTRARA